MTKLITPQELPNWVPGKILGASDALGWTGVGLRSYRYQGQDVEVPALTDFTIIAYLTGSTRMERRFEGAWTRTQCGPGDLSLLTRSQSSHWHWTENIDVAHIYLSEKFVSGISNEIMDRSAAEVRLHDVLKTQDPIISAAAAAIQREANSSAPGSGLYVQAVATQLVVHLLRNYASITFQAPIAQGGLAPAQSKRVADYIESQLHEPLSLEDLALIAGLGVWSFSRRFRQSFGCAPHAYVIARRVEQARRLLTNGVKPIKEIASLCGFADQSHLTRAFQHKLHITPASLRRNLAVV